MIEAPVSRWGPFCVVWVIVDGDGFRVTCRRATWRPPADRPGASRGRAWDARTQSVNSAGDRNVWVL